MLTFGRFQLSLRNHGFLRLDGGAMFGTVPKTIWSRSVASDEDNRILLATRSLILQAGGRVFMIEAGTGDFWPEKFRRVYGIRIEAEAAGPPLLESVTDIIITHFHFDHGGGIARRTPAGNLGPRFPEARIWLQEDNYETARNPNAREKASYPQDLVAVLGESKLDLTRGSTEIYPDLWVHPSNGHTRGLQWVEVRDGGCSIVFPSDMIPYAHHLPLPYTMAYDICAETLLQEKERLLKDAVAGDWIVVFNHDPDVSAARVKIDERGHFAVGERLDWQDGA